MAIDRIDQDLCTGCGICVNSCEFDVIRMDREKKKAKITYGDDCVMCSRCAQDCPCEGNSYQPGPICPHHNRLG